MAQLSLAPANWLIGPQFGGVDYSPGVPTRPYSPWAFDFPSSSGHVGYVTTPGVSVYGKTIRMVFSITGAGALAAKQGGSPPRVWLYFQRRGDNWSGTRYTYEYYRWWSLDGNAALSVPLSQIVVTAKIDPARWSSVNGRLGTANPTKFNEAARNVGQIGFTFGADLYGKGVYKTTAEKSSFLLHEYAVE